MSEIIELIKILRDRTGAGLMDCKKALTENNNDVEAAISWLREKGIAKVAKKATRIAAEGLTNVLVDGDKAIVLEINSETDFVAHSDPFADLVGRCTKSLLASEPQCIDCAREVKLDSGMTVAESFTEATMKLGEKLDLRRFEITKKESDQLFGSYIHMKGKISVLVQVSGGTPELAKSLAMTIAANNPTYLEKTDIPSEVLAKELEVQTELAHQEAGFDKKPQNIQEKIITGRVDKILGEQVLLLQEFVVDPSKTVGQALKEANASIVKYVRYQVGEGIEKRQDDFAKEVMDQAK